MSKKFFINLLFIVFLLTACGKENMNNIEYQEGTFPMKNWSQIDTSFDHECITDRETAVSIGNAILAEFQNQGYFSNYIAKAVFFDTKDEIWIVSFWVDDYPTADFNIALNKDDCKVIKMWVGE